MTSLIEFRDDDAEYLAWLAAHPEGYVINILRGHNAATARMHHAGCRTISGQNPSGGSFVGQYVKVCAVHLVELEQWAIAAVGQLIKSCGNCRPTGAGVHGDSAEQAQPDRGGQRKIHTADAPTASSAVQTVAPPKLDGRFAIHGPEAARPVVEAWADDYIRFEHLPAWQCELRDEIRSRCGQLVPSAGEVLHATYYGSKYPNADVENLVLYNIDSFRVAGSNGIRFEHGLDLPPAPDHSGYRFAYRYALAAHTDTFANWQPGRTLAAFDWIDLGDFAGEKKLAQVWLALARAYNAKEVDADAPASGVETPFAVRVQIRPPLARKPVWGGLVKPVFDGLISAFQAHTDMTVLPHVVEQLAKVLPAAPAEIEQHLLDQRRSVFGVVPRLVKPFGVGVQWDPADHWCVAGELLAADPTGSRWAIKGELVEVSR